MNKHFIIESIDGELAVTILRSGYNIVEKTIHDPELAKSILDLIEERVWPLSK